MPLLVAPPATFASKMQLSQPHVDHPLLRSRRLQRVPPWEVKGVVVVAKVMVLLFLVLLLLLLLLLLLVLHAPQAPHQMWLPLLPKL